MVAFTNNTSAVTDQRYLNAIAAAENFISSNWNASITFSVTWQAQNAGTNNFLATNNFGLVEGISYSRLVSALEAKGSPAANFPSNDPSNGIGWSLPTAYARYLGLTTNVGAPDDTVILNTSYTWAYNGDVTFTLIHELSEGLMGRIGELGLNQDNQGHTLWSTMDLFRYNSAHQHDYQDGKDGQTTFFSLDGGTTLSTSLPYHNQYTSGSNVNHGGDTADWNAFDAFGFGNPGQQAPFSTTDFQVMRALGWSTGLPSTSADWSAAATGFFDSGSNASIFWRNSSGQDLLWLCNSQNVQAGAVSLPTVPTSWTLAGVGDFNNDGTQDILWHNASGQNVIWFMQNNQMVGGGNLPSSGNSWVVGGIGNFDQDGTRNIFWTNVGTGQNLIWDMDHGSIAGGSNLPTTPLSWSPSGIGVSADNERIIFWHNSNGQNVDWLIKNDQLNGGFNLPTTPTSWHVAGIGSFNNDPQEDIFWHNDSGQNLIWFIQNGQLVGGSNLPTTSTDWSPMGVNAFDGDGGSEILWHNAGGQNLIWDIQNGQVSSGSSGALNGNVSGGSGIGGGADVKGSQLTQAMASFSSGAPAALDSAGTDSPSVQVSQLVQAMASFSSGAPAASASGPLDSAQQEQVIAPVASSLGAAHA